MNYKSSTGLKNKLNGILTNLITTGADGTSTTGWTAVDCTLASVGGELELTETGGANKGKAYRDITTIVGQRYTYKFKFRKGTATQGSVIVGIITDDDSLFVTPIVYTDATATAKEVTFIATATTTRITLQTDEATAGTTSYFDDILVAEIFNGAQDILKKFKVAVFDGAQPAAADDVVAGNLLCTYTEGGNDGGMDFGLSVAGVISLDPGQTAKGLVVLGATTTWFRVYQEGDDPLLASTTMARYDGDILTTGGDINMADRSLALGSTQTLTAINFNQL